MTVWSTKDWLIFQMKMKTKCSFYLPVEFPLAASLTGEAPIDGRPAGKRCWLFRSRGEGKLSYRGRVGQSSLRPGDACGRRPAGGGAPAGSRLGSEWAATTVMCLRR